jgi:hypothetical protein
MIYLQIFFTVTWAILMATSGFVLRSSLRTNAEAKETLREARRLKELYEFQIENKTACADMDSNDPPIIW